MPLEVKVQGIIEEIKPEEIEAPTPCSTGQCPVQGNPTQEDKEEEDNE